MENIIFSIINQISISNVDANMIIGGMVVVMMAWCARGVWNAISGRR